MASEYNEYLVKNMQKRIAYFNDAGLCKEAELLQARLNLLEEKNVEKPIEASGETKVENLAAKKLSETLSAKLRAETRYIPDLEKQYILENLSKAQTLKELEPLRISYIERLVKINRAKTSKEIAFVPESDTEAGPYNNEKIFCEALRLIHSQDPLWIEDLKELYFSIMPFSSSVAVSKSPL
ncbi:MAG: hypothetical protein FWF63_06160 [Fibromonadales bacterium]|nr:hypothetical protein [Fibromonadales bacterium]